MPVEQDLDAAIERHRAGALDEADRLYAEILAADPDNHRALSVSAILEHQSGRTDEAIRRLERAIELAPEIAGYHNNLGNLFRHDHRPELALDCYRRALEIDGSDIDTICNLGSLSRRMSLPNARQILEVARDLAPTHPETNHNLALVYSALDMEKEALDCIEACHADDSPRPLAPTYHARILARYGRREQAIDLLERCLKKLPEHPELTYELAAIRGERLERAPDDYVRQHFDGFAEGFDNRLADLDYLAPKYVGDIATTLLDGAKARLIVDLGCGTGLVGPYLRPLCEQLIGVDLSTRMLQQAERRGCYDKLGAVELTEALWTLPEGSVDLATAADTLCYFGDLAPFCAVLARALRTGGAFVGTVEFHAGDEPPRILDSGRFSHGEPYIARISQQAGLKLQMARQVDLRLEFGEPVRGLVFVLEKL